MSHAETWERAGKMEQLMESSYLACSRQDGGQGGEKEIGGGVRGEGEGRRQTVNELMGPVTAGFWS